MAKCPKVGVFGGVSGGEVVGRSRYGTRDDRSKVTFHAAFDEKHASTELASRRTGMSFQRTRMSADRTLMSVIRTSLSLISFGFTIYQFFEKLQNMIVMRPFWRRCAAVSLPLPVRSR